MTYSIKFHSLHATFEVLYCRSFAVNLDSHISMILHHPVLMMMVKTMMMMKRGVSE